MCDAMHYLPKFDQIELYTDRVMCFLGYGSEAFGNSRVGKDKGKVKLESRRTRDTNSRFTRTGMLYF